MARVYFSGATAKKVMEQIVLKVPRVRSPYAAAGFRGDEAASSAAQEFRKHCVAEEQAFGGQTERVTDML
jgi:hypothetical protein